MPILFNPNKKKGVFMIPTGGTQAISCAFSYSAASYTDADPDPTPTVTGTSGGTFTSTAGIVINADTGEIDLSASAVNTYVVTYTVGAKACTQSVEITASFSNTKSLAFDGVDDYVDCGNPTELQITGALTISCWVKSSDTTDYVLVQKDDIGVNRSYALWGNEWGGAPKVCQFIVFNGGSATSVKSATDINDGNWHNVVAVFNPSTTMQIYIDGSLDGENTTSIPTSIDNDPVNFQIGRGGNGAYYMDGNVDEVGIWDVALASTEVTELYTNGPIDLNTDTGNYTSSSDLQAWYRMGDKVTSFPTIPDQVGSNDGTATNMNISDIETDVPT